MRQVDLDRLGAALGDLGPDPRVVVSGNFASPLAVLGALDAHLERYRLHALNAQPGLPDREGVVYETAFVGPGMRDHPRLDYVPCRLSLVPRLLRGPLHPDAVVVHTTLPHKGTVSLGIETNVLPAAIEAARAAGRPVIAQMNPRMPYTMGDSVVPVGHIDLGVEVDAPLVEAPAAGPLDEASAVIGAQVAARVADGSTLQLGIGAVPDAVLAGLRARRDLRIWSEMCSDGVLGLEHAGALDASHRIHVSFLFGSAELYDWVDHNPRVHMARTETANDPIRIARQHQMVAINTALEVDLYGQANASRRGGRIYSGFGGQADFVVGALHSVGGQALCALRSWHPSADCSTIVPLVHEAVTSFQPTAVVTEQGVAELFGHSAREQARHLIDRAAHPRARESLRREATQRGIVQL